MDPEVSPDFEQIDQMVPVDGILSGTDLWDQWTAAARKIYFLVRRSGLDPSSPSKVQEYMAHYLGAPVRVTTPRPAWVWHLPQDQFALRISSRGMEFLVASGLEPQAAFEIWKGFTHKLEA